MLWGFVVCFKLVKFIFILLLEICICYCLEMIEIMMWVVLVLREFFINFCIIVVKELIIFLVVIKLIIFLGKVWIWDCIYIKVVIKSF